ncbi:AAA family ATPase [Candidatus Woesearchaeota archaeon]|nr:AAA family ATPase [Candidatus Woesearchaeota archaeon]
MMKENAKTREGIYYGYTADISHLEEENRVLRSTVASLREEVMRFKRTPLLVCEVTELNEGKALVRLPNGNLFYVDVSNGCPKLKPGDFALAHQKNLTLVDKVPISKQFNVDKFVIMDKPTVSWADIGGLNTQIEEIQEVVELPLKKPELFKTVGITPPKAILLHGPPGTGKTLLAKAVANSTNSTFIEIVASELVQKFIGEGAKLVNEIFKLAKEKAPSIIFIDELDAIAATRVEIGTSGEREVQRTFMQLLAEIDGFKPLGDVKVIGCTNRKDILDPAILRPGRLDRQIFVPIPDGEGRKEILKIHTQKMSLSKSVDLAKLSNNMEEFSGAEIQAVCTEAGYYAIRANRKHLVLSDFVNAIEKVKLREEFEAKDYEEMFV